jgi:hypothetical protein
MRRFLSCLLLLLVPSQGRARTALPQLTVECRAQFAKTADHAGIVKLYGAKNVTYESVNRAEGEVVKATVLFANNPSRRLEIEWFDEARRRLPSTITVFGQNNQWIGPRGIRNGMTIQEIEQRAGRPFKISGFGFDGAGAGHFEETSLANLPGDCSFRGNFEIETDASAEALDRVNGDIEIDSNNPALLALKPRLWIYTLSYPVP